ncbi:MAG: hypothetical protein JWN98_2581 [Abditibacteriota bacterium]|jgi:putative membrane protein|nr:hypothetical protein [Abditibacteriota bacterium]
MNCQRASMTSKTKVPTYFRAAQVWGSAVLWFALNQAQVWAQDAASNATAARSDYRVRSLTDALLSTVLFGLLGIALAIVGFKLLDIVVKFDLEREICEKQNLAVAVLCGLMVLGICLIIAATVMS